ncbi:MAG: ABC transporter permease [Leptolyngbya sp. IPPAS B-1204]|nr:MAG: ABC transporter permease [Leptolyngbya sp. IPPAS B-1204]
MHLGRTFVIAANVFREVIRDRILYLIAFYGLVLAAATQLLPWVAANTQDKILLDLGIAAISLLGLLVAVFVGTGLVNKEIEKRTVFVMIAKPISTAEFIVGKHWGLTAVLAVLVAAMTGIFFAVLSVQQIPFPVLSLSLAALFQILELSLISAVAILFGVLTSPVLAMLLTLAIYLMGHLSRDLLTLGNLAKDTALSQVTQALYLILPDLARLDWKNQAVYGMELMPSPFELASHAAYGLIYTALLLAIATFIFSRRQF